MRKTWLAVAMACCLAFAGCDTDPEPPGASIGPSPTGPQPLPAPTAQDQVAPTPDKDGRFKVKAVSAPVEVGVPYEFSLFTRCGLDALVDFNGALWDAIDPAGSAKKGPPEGFETPRDTGVMTLVNQEMAEFESSFGKVVRFIRHAGQKRIEPCPSDGG